MFWGKGMSAPVIPVTLGRATLNMNALSPWPGWPKVCFQFPQASIRFSTRGQEAILNHPVTAATLSLTETSLLLAFLLVTLPVDCT